ncbi:hypothetical protein RHE_PF00136 (plasmid) [Rhizobium etli CFN 42]|uniref:Uncharacterized protein n=1 Tax=Rhizobium etli (strain ATCC 51251 / DSM 11541 / JCM 21823 / NBRC 15573 / CFN 42) TaxID=347834 RepID=Q2JZF9_RHIEC|nr:hypothetical protein RHE_PF00136 [Rhizobium etli CFN 42]
MKARSCEYPRGERRLHERPAGSLGTSTTSDGIDASALGDAELTRIGRRPAMEKRRKRRVRTLNALTNAVADPDVYRWLPNDMEVDVDNLFHCRPHCQVSPTTAFSCPSSQAAMVGPLSDSLEENIGRRTRSLMILHERRY